MAGIAPQFTLIYGFFSGAVLIIIFRKDFMSDSGFGTDRITFIKALSGRSWTDLFGLESSTTILGIDSGARSILKTLPS